MPQIFPMNISPNYPGEAAASKTKQEEMFKSRDMLGGGWILCETYQIIL